LADQAHSLSSPVGGTPIARLSGMNAANTEKLYALAVFDAEQLLGIIAATGGTRALSASTGLTDQEIATVTDAAASALPSHVAQQYSSADHVYRALGALDLTEQKRAEIQHYLSAFPDRVTGLPHIALPQNVNHIAAMMPIQTQGARETCVGFGSTSMHEYLCFTVSKVQTKLSEEFAYDMCKQIDGNPAGCGTWLLDAVKILSQYGQCAEQFLSYNPNVPCNHSDAITAQMNQSAAQFRSTPTYYSNPRDINAMKQALALRNSNVGFCIPVYNSWYRSNAVTVMGQITMPLSGEQSIGGHCMCIVGYQDNAAYPGGGTFILRNSWGISWGFQSPYGAGYGTIPYAYISEYCTEAASY
jgi:hypothetical protein